MFSRLKGEGSRRRSSGPQPEELGNGSTGNSRTRAGTNQSMLERQPSGVREVNEPHIMSGFMEKKGVINQAWKHRFFLLTSKFLYYFESKPKPGEFKPRGQIALAIISSVEPDPSSPEKFNIVTPSRIYKLKTERQSERDSWVAAITGAWQNERQKTARPRRESSASPMDSIKEEMEVFEESVQTSYAPYTPAALEDWRKWNNYEVIAYLQKFGLSKQISEIFYKNGITGEELENLSTTQLEKFGIDSLEEQLKILNAVKKLKGGEIHGE